MPDPTPVVNESFVGLPPSHVHAGAVVVVDVLVVVVLVVVLVDGGTVELAILVVVVALVPAFVTTNVAGRMSAPGPGSPAIVLMTSDVVAGSQNTETSVPLDVFGN